MAQVHQSPPVTQADTVNDPDETHKSGGLRAKLKQKLFHHGSQKGESSESHNSADGPNESGKQDLNDGDSGAEVLGLMRTRTNSNESPSARKASPALERHITAISESDDEDEPETGHDLPPKLKRHISSVPVDDYDSEEEQPAPTPAKVQKQDSGIAGTDFEEVGIMRIPSDELSPPGADKSPQVSEHISTIPKSDEPRRKSPMSKLERTISSIPADDYDSDADQASYKFK
ncbi:hypothetical protein CLAFUW4_02889 [Fulvia fulva]|uniref:Uncharacterized protein n=1 Tax=Passalora fulva TaxID=5499 RepID=A0A9Q8LAL0_PASFU|nr:uncharacterized protein CLAFUR5_02877 [Fulvia fulva]KAK4631730.1 hypothetical protein CLAFUR4_02882 [Fulvia fulva]KAK4633640.1 hypothetical protein CLAFUR0_02885 [Fulvia fulva]UJO13238.1 hypothetical protein CLAFUR5_02877 [Fulvia fulva]WPV10713.1 hypothetical protein CLAFUW4_02889 [Fulvia fulva]WPV26086.1 hypothetical protein CLAFUW7_02886 [Fulvia fulva]